MIGQTISHYRILERLGQGGMGVVYKAEDTRLRREVAVKFLSEALVHDRAAVERFEREARAASALSHPHICAIYDTGWHQSSPFIVMELLEGAPLGERINGRPLPTERVLDVAQQLVDAVDAAHQRQIVHRDIKPANIFVTERGEAKLLDLRLAKPQLDAAAGSSGATEPQLTHSGAVLGTLSYM